MVKLIDDADEWIWDFPEKKGDFSCCRLEYSLEWGMRRSDHYRILIFR